MPEALEHSESPILLDKRSWHTAFEQQVNAAQSYGGSLSVLFVDVNNFKVVNDTLGHLIGDEVIYQIGLAVSQVTDQYLVGGHIGGDEFAISGAANRSETILIKERLYECFANFLNRPESAELQGLGLGLAIGAATYERGMSSSELLTRANQAMFEDKQRQLEPLTEARSIALAMAAAILQSEGLSFYEAAKYERLLRKQT